MSETFEVDPTEGPVCWTCGDMLRCRCGGSANDAYIKRCLKPLLAPLGTSLPETATGDVISRQVALKELDDLLGELIRQHPGRETFCEDGKCDGILLAYELIESVPAATPVVTDPIEAKALELSRLSGIPYATAYADLKAVEKEFGVTQPTSDGDESVTFVQAQRMRKERDEAIAALWTREKIDAVIDGLGLMHDPSNGANVRGHIGALMLRDALLLAQGET